MPESASIHQFVTALAPTAPECFIDGKLVVTIELPAQP